MKVSTARRRLAERLGEALESGDGEEVCRIADYVKAVGAALAARGPDEEVDLASLTVNSEEAAHILGYHREHVRRLARTALIEAEKEGKQLRIPVASIIAVLEGRVPASLAPGVKRFLELLGVPLVPPPRPEAKPGG